MRDHAHTLSDFSVPKRSARPALLGSPFPLPARGNVRRPRHDDALVSLAPSRRHNAEDSPISAHRFRALIWTEPDAPHWYLSPKSMYPMAPDPAHFGCFSAQPPRKPLILLAPSGPEWDRRHFDRLSFEPSAFSVLSDGPSMCRKRSR